ncbi:hypothetical protein A1O7_01417 [Cladophialophora yegresii CBS 114405]|uniref:Uncharacterized protein n=1 Tax=Cladophialophora yegresii CBS 114405 TaxID=1182544 RepID=W9WAC6_9EURO|nr:uncharacterized protein A1O7_01417 [Cladophialophora yegresii CBS 114405]EXJ65077.1 hypothetical protein A1O7_01417 [Cladophialophora yegresii CBS 114405]
MSTLINYNQATFKDHPEPNKRRLQELQHSAARAHAARVAYWRKRGVQSVKSRAAEHRQRQDDGTSNASTESTIHVKQECNSVVVPKLARLPVSSLFDPFDAIPIAQNADVVAAIDHYINKWAPSQRPGLKYQTKDNPLIRDAFPAGLQNVELFEAIVALCLSFKAAAQNFEPRVCSRSLYHKGQALSGIRNKLTSGWVDEAVILATVFLMIIDNVFLDIQAYETHLHGLRKMAKASRAESNALLLFGDRISLHRSVTSGACLEYPSQPFPSTLTIVIGTLTPGFQTLASDGQLSVEVLSNLAKTVHWSRCIDPEPGQSPSGTDQAFLMTFDPRANSADLMRLCRIAGKDCAVERAVCKAVYVYHANLLGWTCRCSGYRRVVEELGTALRRWDFHKTWDKDLWKWLALVTANAARRGKLQHLQTEVMTSLFASSGSGQDWKSVQTATKKFLYHSALSQEWEICWHMAHASTA